MDTTDRHFRCSTVLGQLAAALAKAQGQIKGAVKDAANPFFKSKYADLASIRDACFGPLSANGLAVVQFPRSTEDGVEVETLLVHESGEWVSETLSLPVAKHDAQGVGSAITYARRYALASIAGVAPEDDDGQAAARSMKDAPPKAEKPPAKASPNYFEMAVAELAKVGITKEQFTEHLKHHGLTAYVHKRDAHIVDDLVMGARANMQPEPEEVRA